MKPQYLFLLALFAIFVIQVQAYGSYDDYEEWEDSIPDSCQELFNTTHCSKCQSLIWEHFENPGQCATVFNIGQEIVKIIKEHGKLPEPYDLTFFKKGVRNYCHKGFHCSQKEAEKIYNEIQHVCKDELSVKFDWSDDPSTYEDITSYAAYGALLTYYTGIPARKAFCTKNKHGGKILF
jgi:hypothetical protein